MLNQAVPQIALPLATLVLSPDDVRQHDKADDPDDMIASIREQGVLQPLSYVPEDRSDSGMNEITAGRRRLKALMTSASNGEIDPETYLVPLVEEGGDRATRVTRSLKRSIAEDMASYRGQSVAEAMIRKTDIAHKSLVFILALKVIFDAGDRDSHVYVNDGVDYSARGGLALSPKVPHLGFLAAKDHADTAAGCFIAEAKTGLDLD